jgi:hypothetical protein
MFLAHAPISFLSNKIIQRKRISKLSQNEKIFVGIFAILAGVAPDLDIFVLQGLNLPTFMHHTIISHTLVFYVGLWLLLKFLVLIFYKAFNKQTVKFLNRELLNILLDTFLIATLLHILADFLIGRIMILYPFSTQGYTILETLLEPNLFAGYFFGTAFGIEVVICAVFFAHVITIIFKKSIFTKILNVCVITFAILFLGLNLFSSYNTYNKSIPRDQNGINEYDMDSDFVLDEMDMDINNDGTDNILDVDIKELVSQIKNIILSSTWSAYDDNRLISAYKRQSGGFTSYRLISQAYFNLHSPIAPVLWNQATIDGDINNYTDELDGLTTLYNYFEKKQMLAQLTTEETVFANGTIFFILDAQKHVSNVGIVIGNDSVGIVLPYDKRVQTHTFSDVTNYYGNDIIIEFTK